MDLGQGIGGGAGMGVAGNEEDVQLPREQALRILLAIVRRIRDVVTELLAPDGHDLRHDAGVVPLEARSVVARPPVLPDGAADELDEADA